MDFIDAVPGMILGVMVVGLGELVRAGSAISLLNVGVRRALGVDCHCGAERGRVVIVSI